MISYNEFKYGCSILLIEDIYDTEHTLKYLIKILE